MVETDSSNPVRPSDRREILDIVRGFALFGVLVANMVWTTQWFATPDEVREQLNGPLDEVVGLLVVVFIDFKFITLFSMLFGLGLAIQVRSARDKGVALAPTYLRRMLILWILGVAHATLIWFGDILHFYAALGVVLLFLTRFSPRMLAISGLCLGIVHSLLPALDLVLEAAAFSAPYEEPDGDIDPNYLVLTEGSYVDIVRMQTRYALEDYASFFTDPSQGPLYYYLGPLWKFMLGYALGATGLHERPADLLRLAKRVLPWAFTFGISGSALTGIALVAWDVWLPEGSLLARLTWAPIEFATLSLSLAYACSLIVLFNHPTTRRVVRLLAPVGRMALTNYLTHSLLFVILLYAIGFGLLGSIGTTAAVAICLAIFGVQIVFSAWWLEHFCFGPMEWAWRSLTHFELQKFRKP